MQRTLLMAATVSASLLLVGGAVAQTASDVNWTGIYAGVNLGVGGNVFDYPYSGSTDAAGTNPVAGKFRQSSSGGLLGGQIGFNYQSPNGVVLGLETDLDGSTIIGDSAFSSVDSLGRAYGGAIKSQIDGLGTLRARLGEAMFGGRFLPYVTGGLAYGGVSSTASYACSTCASGAGVASVASQYAVQTGWTAGLGAEYALSRHLSFRAEYLYADLGGRNLATDATTYRGPGFTVDNATVGVNTTANLLRVGLNYRF